MFTDTLIPKTLIYRKDNVTVTVQSLVIVELNGKENESGYTFIYKNKVNSYTFKFKPDLFQIYNLSGVNIVVEQLTFLMHTEKHWLNKEGFGMLLEGAEEWVKTLSGFGMITMHENRGDQ